MDSKTVNIDKQQHKDLKIEASKLEISMQDLLKTIIQEYLNERAR